MPFQSSSWSAPHTIDTRDDTCSVVQSWQNCQTKGIYVIRDEFDSRTLYVGMADKSHDIQGRLLKHFTEKGNDGIANLVENKQTFTVRWAASQNPGLSEGIAIAQLSPLFNKRRELADIRKTDSVATLREIGRLDLATPERPDAIPVQEQANAEKIDGWMHETRTDEVVQDHVNQYPSHIPQDRMQAVRDLLPDSSPALEDSNTPDIDAPAPGRS